MQHTETSTVTQDPCADAQCGSHALQGVCSLVHCARGHLILPQDTRCRYRVQRAVTSENSRALGHPDPLVCRQQSWWPSQEWVHTAGPRGQNAF